MALQEWEILSLDVWGNEDDGFEINQAFHTGKWVELAEEWTKADVFAEMKAAGMLSDAATKADVSIEDMGETMISIDDAQTGEPLWQLQRPYEKNPRRRKSAKRRSKKARNKRTSRKAR